MNKNNDDCNARHIAFILDGNRRWAVKNNLSKLEGHTHGAKNVMSILSYIQLHTRIKYVTLYAFSEDNWKRSLEEVSWLMSLFKKSMIDFLRSSNIVNFKIKFIGMHDNFPADVREMMFEIEEKTKNNGNGVHVMIALGYSSRAEIVNAAKRISQMVLDGKLQIDKINRDVFESCLYTAGIPDPDILIRTSEVRLSDFLLWQISYSELFFVDKYWPEFSVFDLQIIIDEYNCRGRRHGK